MLAGHRDDVMAVLDAADVFLHPTRADVFPTVLLEALAAGTPIVASRVEGVPEIVDDNPRGCSCHRRSRPPRSPISSGASSATRIWRAPSRSAGRALRAGVHGRPLGRTPSGLADEVRAWAAARSGQLRRTTAAARLTVGRA